MKSYLLILLLFCTMVGCSAPDSEEPIRKPPKNVDVDADVEYDDGTTCIVNVKIAIDKRGWQAQKPEYHKEMLERQWKLVTRRFNDCDKKNQLKRKYVFVPDLEDILLYETSAGWCKDLLDQLDKKRFQLLFIYDSYYEPQKGEHSGGCATFNGISTVLLIQSNPNWANKYFNYMEGKTTMEAITHEMGHFRGVIDIYNNILNADKNKVNGKAHKPISCIMNDIAYNPIATSYWSDYSIKVLNKTGNRKIVNIIVRTMYDYFPDKLTVKVTQRGLPIEAKVNFYPMVKKEITGLNKSQYIVPLKGITLDAKKIFYPPFNDNIINDWSRHSLILLEAEKLDGSEKAYAWINDYELHNTGLDGKQEHEVTIKF